jgi:hypothetical protein
MSEGVAAAAQALQAVSSAGVACALSDQRLADHLFFCFLSHRMHHNFRMQL